MSELPNTIGPGFQQDIDGRLDKLEELVLAMGEVLATKRPPITDSFKREFEGNLDLATRLFDELKARRAAVEGQKQ